MKKFFLLLLLLPTLLFASEIRWTEYDTTGRKDVGLNAKIKYPSSFSAKEGRRPHILGKFNLEIKGRAVQLMIQAHRVNFKKTYGKSPLKVTERDLKDIVKGLKSGVSEMFKNSQSTYLGSTKIEGYPTLLLDVKGEAERAGNVFYSNENVAIVLTKTHHIFLWCGTLSSVNDKENVDSIQSVIKERVCQPYQNSLMLIDEYNY